MTTKVKLSFYDKLFISNMLRTKRYFCRRCHLCITLKCFFYIFVNEIARVMRAKRASRVVRLFKARWEWILSQTSRNAACSNHDDCDVNIIHYFFLHA